MGIARPSGGGERDGRNGKHEVVEHRQGGTEGGLTAEAIGSLFDLHHDRMWRFLHQRGGRACADELAGEVFTAALASRDRFDPDRGDPVAWLYGIAANLARAWVRRQARRRRAMARLEGLVGTGSDDDPAGDITDRVAGAAEAARVLQALRSLPDADQEVLVLAAGQQLSYEAMAAVLGVPLGTVRSRLSRARARLRELVGPRGQEPVDMPIEEP